MRTVLDVTNEIQKIKEQEKFMDGIVRKMEEDLDFRQSIIDICQADIPKIREFANTLSLTAFNLQNKLNDTEVDI